MDFVVYVGGNTTAYEEYTRCIEYILTEDQFLIINEI
ncbi:hypothetical protein SDC9_72200 [bioreactor metagenome]|uniref:Uncharacterized protein n=1 Tax=bioreactor metagenome TaxID=1076179 RepID=A0A644YB34_9ZZZZ